MSFSDHGTISDLSLAGRWFSLILMDAVAAAENLFIYVADKVIRIHHLCIIELFFSFSVLEASLTCSHQHGPGSGGSLRPVVSSPTWGRRGYPRGIWCQPGGTVPRSSAHSQQSPRLVSATGVVEASRVRSVFQSWGAQHALVDLGS